MLDSKYSTVSGDVVLGAAYMIYAGAFIQKYRNLLISLWRSECLRPYELGHSETFKFVELYGDQNKIREWRQNGLMEDAICTTNALLMHKAMNIADESGKFIGGKSGFAARTIVACIDP